MIAAFIMLTSLIALLPALVMVDGILAHGVVSAIVGIAMVTVVLALDTNGLNRFSRLLGPTAFVVLFIPCLWMLLQVLPISIRSLANPDCGVLVHFGCRGHMPVQLDDGFWAELTQSTRSQSLAPPNCQPEGSGALQRRL